MIKMDYKVKYIFKYLLFIILSNIMDNYQLFKYNKQHQDTNYQDHLDTQNNHNLNHVSMSSIEPAAMQTQAQTKLQGGRHQNNAQGARADYPGREIVHNSKRGDNQTTDSMVFLKSPENIEEVQNGIEVNEIPGFPVRNNQPREGQHFLGLKTETSDQEHSDMKQPEQIVKRNALKKNAFDSDLGLQQTGRFEASPNPVPEHIPNTVKTGKLGTVINEGSADSPEVHVRDFDRLGMHSHYGDGSNQENEMRETSYFKQQTDDEGSPNKGDPNSLSELISITNQQQQPSQKSSSNTASDVIKSGSSAIISYQERPSEQVLADSTDASLQQQAKRQNAGLVHQKQPLDRKAPGANGNTRNQELKLQQEDSARIQKTSQQEGIQMFKMSSRTQMKHRAQKNSKKITETNNESEPANEPFSPSSRAFGQSQISSSLETPPPAEDDSKRKQSLGVRRPNLSYHRSSEEGHESDQFLRSKSYQVGSSSQLKQNDQQFQPLQIEDDSPLPSLLPEDSQLLDTELKALQKNEESSPAEENINERQLKEIQKINEQNQKQQLKNVNVTGNFGALAIQKQQSNNDSHNYSVLKGAIPSKADQILDNESETPQHQQQMFTSMSDIGFPQNIHNYNAKATKPASKNRQAKKGELITPDQIQRMMNTQNNWRVRTKTIDEMLHDIQDRIENDPEYIMKQSEKLVDFFVQLLSDQNFKIVLNTLNILNMILSMPDQCKRYAQLLKNEVPPDESWGLSNAMLGRHIPQIVKKLADSKNIIRQEAIKCLASMNEIMRNGNKKDNNFIALILPYLNNSSNWHIREELLNLLIKSFLRSNDQSEFDSYQIMDSVLQLFNDTKEKIRNLALEAIAAFASIGQQSKVNEILFQLNVDKEICELIQSRFEYGMFPTLNQEGNVEIPYQDQFQNYDVDSVAHSMANQSQVVSQYSHEHPRRKQSLGGGSQAGYQVSKGRGNSSGRKIVVATANATNQQLGVSHHDEIIQQAYIQSKRTASANNPNQFDFDNPNLNQNEQNFISEQNQGNSFSYSVGGGTAGGNKQQRDKLLDELGIQQDLNGSSFLPSLQRVYTDHNGNQYSSQHNNRDRIVGSSGGLGIGYIGGIAQGNIDPNLIVGSAGGGQHAQMLISGGNKRSNKYLHGTPGHPSNYQAHFSSQNGTNLQAQFNRGNSGKIPANHNMNNSISNKSPSMFDQNTLFDMSGHVASLFGNETKSGSNNYEQMQRVNINQQMSDMGLHEHHEILSSGGMNNSHFHQQTPSSQFGHDQSMGYQADAYIPGMPDVGDFTTLGIGPGNMAGAVPNMGTTPSPHADQRSLFVHESRRHVAQGHKSSIGGQGHNGHPASSEQQNMNNMINEHQNEEMNFHKASGKSSRASHRHQRDISNAQQQQLGLMPSSSKKNNQNTFYSDGTTFTGITTTTGATSQNKGANQKTKIIMIKGAGQSHGAGANNQVLDEGHNDFRQHVINAGAGPIRATRAALGGLVPAEDRQELCIDNRKIKSSSQNPTAKLKISTKMQGSAQGMKQLKRDESNESDRMFERDVVQNRSFSHNKSHPNAQAKELQSAGMPQRHGYLGGEAIGQSAYDESGEDPALLTQSSKIQYVQTDQLEPLEKPEKEYKKSISKNQGIYSEDWFDQFDACNVIRRVCKHHQSLILQTGNSLQSLVGTLIKLADSLRSAVTRIALMTLTDMFQTLKRVMEPCLVSIVKILIKRGSDTNHFIAEEADKCLAIMVRNCQESKVLQILQMQNMNSRSNLQRLKFCQCLTNIVKQLDNNILFFKENDKLLVQLAKYLQDASQDVRQEAKAAFVAMSQAIMGQNQLEKLLQRVLNEVQYKKVREFLDKEPTHLVADQGRRIDFVITTASSSAQNVLNKKTNNNKQSAKTLRHNGHIPKQNTAVTEQEEPLNMHIQAKSILNPQLAKQESSGFLNKIAQQNKVAGQPAKKEDFQQLDQFFLDTVKDLILRTQVNEWRLRLESSEQLFDLIRSNIEQFSKNFRLVELADALCKLLNDANAKIQISALENFSKMFHLIAQYVEKYLQLFYKAIITNLGSPNPGVRKLSEQILKQFNDGHLLSNQTVLLQPLISMIQNNSGTRLKPALIDQLIDLIDKISDKQILQKQVLPLSYKLLEDNKLEIKQRSERLIRKLYSMPDIGQSVLHNCPQIRLQRVCDICLSSSKNLNATGSSGIHSSQSGTNGPNQIHLNSMAFK